LLDWLARKHGKEGLAKGARLVERAVDDTLKQPACRTPDLGGELGTKAFAAAICKQIERDTAM